LACSGDEACSAAFDREEFGLVSPQVEIHRILSLSASIRHRESGDYLAGARAYLDLVCDQSEVWHGNRHRDAGLQHARQLEAVSGK
jgi:hypothetical protein